MPYKHRLASKNIVLEAKIMYALRYWMGYHQYYTVDNYDSITFLLDELRKVFDNPDKPILEPRPLRGNIPLMYYDLNKIFYETDADLDIIYKALNHLSNSMVSHFNYAQTNKSRLKQRLRKLSSMTNEFHLLSYQRYKNVHYISDNFNDTDKIDQEMITSRPAQVLTNEGVVTLGFDSSVNNSLKAKIERISGNGHLGNYHVVRRDVLNDNTNTLSRNMFYLAHEDPHDNPSTVLDNKPDTWIEYQMLNFPTDKKESYLGYSFPWATGKRHGDTLRMRMVIKLDTPQDVNWIHIDPYLPPGYALGKITVYSLGTSMDGIHYDPIYHYRPILHSDIDLIVVSEPHIIPDHVNINGMSDSKMAGQGIWNFSTRRAQYIEVILDQQESHPEEIGIPIYHRITTKRDSRGRTVETTTQITPREVSQEIQNDLPGRYPISDTTHIDKDIEVVAGWRYCLGLRDINIYTNTFADTSEIISQPHILEREIEAISLSVLERVPDEFIDVIETRNDWIQYYISLNDIDWYQISPVHHNVLTEDTIPPKIYTLNTHYYADSNERPGYIETDEPVHQVRLKAVFTRPEHLPSFTPILEEYTLRFVLKE